MSCVCNMCWDREVRIQCVAMLAFIIIFLRFYVLFWLLEWELPSASLQTRVGEKLHRLGLQKTQQMSAGETKMSRQWSLSLRLSQTHRSKLCGKIIMTGSDGGHSGGGQRPGAGLAEKHGYHAPGPWQRVQDVLCVPGHLEGTAGWSLMTGWGCVTLGQTLCDTDTPTGQNLSLQKQAPFLAHRNNEVAWPKKLLPG